MNKYNCCLSLLLALLICLSACNSKLNGNNIDGEKTDNGLYDNTANTDNQLDQSEYHTIDTSVLYKAHGESMRKEKIQIEDYVRRHQWNMTTTPTGLNYMIYQHGNGKKVEKGDIVIMEYLITFLNGDSVYSSKEDGLKEFEITRSNEISGLEEGLLLMHKGDRAKLIVPSFLAYGVTGDFNKISIKNTLVYDIHLVDIK